MIAGHFGLAAGVKAGAPGIPLWVLMVSTQWLDIWFVPLFLMGIETIEPVDLANPNAYGATIIHANFTHSLVGALALSLLLGGLAWWRWGRRAGGVIAAVAFSHWVLDLVVHRPDLPILPGNAGDLPLLGFGLWRLPTVTAFVELAMVLAGAYLYYRSALRFTPAHGQASPEHRRRVIAATAVVLGLMLLSLITNVLGV
jgi:membrane-bound metal-dependent hydrolase YbcI (DUF457 family)